MTYQESQRLIFEAESAIRAGDKELAQQLFMKAADIQRKLLTAVPKDRVKTKSIFGLSVASLLYKAGELDACEKAAWDLLSQPWVEPHSASKLKELLGAIWGSRKDEVELTAQEGADILSVRIISQLRRSAIRLRGAWAMYRDLYGLFLAGATAESVPLPYHPYAHSIGSDFAAGLSLFPATEHSFAFVVKSDLDGASLSNYFNGNVDAASDFKRRVMARVVRGLHRCKVAYDNENRWDDLSHEYLRGMNANMSEAVVRMYQEVATSDASIEFNVAWAPDRDTPADLVGIGPIRYDEPVVRTAYLLSNAIKRDPKIPNIDVVGYVVGLKDKSSDDTQLTFQYDQPGPGEESRSDKDKEVSDPYDTDRVATVKVERVIASGGVNFAMLRMSLDDERYALACEAHRPKTKFLVRAKGQLVRRGRMFTLDPCEYFDKYSP